MTSFPGTSPACSECNTAYCRYFRYMRKAKADPEAFAKEIDELAARLAEMQGILKKVKDKK